MGAPILCKDIPYTFKDPSLLENRSFVGGEWIYASDSSTFPVYSPEDNTIISHITNLTPTDIQSAIESAHATFQSYRKTTARERRFLIRRWADQIRANAQDLAAICTLELGKPFTESLGTVQYGLDFLDWFEGCIEHCSRGDTIPAAKPGNRIFTILQPQGVVAAITPWNSPIAMITRKVGAAIAAGNTVVCKPAPETPLCATALGRLFERAVGEGDSKKWAGVLNVVTTERAAEFGNEVCGNPLVRHVSFTGSTEVGRLLHVACARTFKKTSMELGGNAPFIVFGDAGIGKAVDGLIASKFRSSGQTCVCANRIFVHSSIIHDFTTLLSARLAATFRYGSIWDTKVNYGPLYSGKALEKLKMQMEDALARGASAHVSDCQSSAEKEEEEKAVLGPNFYPPTIITGATTDMLFMQQETFGPLAFLVPFETEEEVIGLANRTSAGLAAYVYTENISRVWRVSEALETGMVGVRVGLISACEQPFGGVKESGVGREGGVRALQEYMEVKSVTVGV